MTCIDVQNATLQRVLVDWDRPGMRTEQAVEYPLPLHARPLVSQFGAKVHA